MFNLINCLSYTFVFLHCHSWLLLPEHLHYQVWIARLRKCNSNVKCANSFFFTFVLSRYQRLKLFHIFLKIKTLTCFNVLSSLRFLFPVSDVIFGNAQVYKTASRLKTRIEFVSKLHIHEVRYSSNIKVQPQNSSGMFWIVVSPLIIWYYFLFMYGGEHFSALLHALYVTIYLIIFFSFTPSIMPQK